MEVSLNDMLDGMKRVRNFIKNNKRLPETLDLKNRNTNKMVTIQKAVYNGMYFNMFNFWLKQGRFPNYVTKNITYGEPMILNHQDNKYNCCPASLSMISTKLYNPKSEKELANVLGTNTSGTNPDNLYSKGKVLGFLIKPIPRNAVAVKQALDQYKGVLCHYETGDASCSGFENNYGHYCVIKSVKDGYYEIYDPTRLRFMCKTSIMDRATNGRKINYYSVELL